LLPVLPPLTGADGRCGGPPQPLGTPALDGSHVHVGDGAVTAAGGGRREATEGAAVDALNIDDAAADGVVAVVEGGQEIPGWGAGGIGVVVALGSNLMVGQGEGTHPAVASSHDH
jgi:hypothetical protein